MEKAVAVRVKFGIAKRSTAELTVKGKDVMLSEIELPASCVPVCRLGSKVYVDQPKARTGDVAVCHRVLDCNKDGCHAARVLPDGFVALGTIPEAGNLGVCRA